MIFTFYSFKGGVGRSMALANIAEVFYARGLNVLMIDFDLEAPGLERYFNVSNAIAPSAEVLSRRGVVDLILSFLELQTLAPKLPPAAAVDDATEQSFPFSVEPLSSFIVPIYDDHRRPGRLSLMPSGNRRKPDFAAYAKRVLGLDWAKFYTEHNGEQFFEWLRRELLRDFDVVLIDSRTGVTELGGVCTHHLADAVVSFVATNRQNLEGSAMMARSLANPSLIAEGRKGRPLQQLFVPSRVESSEEDKHDDFALAFDGEFKKYFPSESPPDKGWFLDLRLSYVAAYSYMERVAVREPERASKADLIQAYGRLAERMARLAGSGQLYDAWAPASQVPSNLPPRNPFFVGREDDLKRIRSLLPNGTPVAICGLAGMGKTSLALEYAYRFRGENSATLFCPVSSTDEINRGLEELMQLLEMADARSSPRDAVREWLGSNSGWLLILDDVIDPGLARSILPPTIRGHVLYTTRTQQVSQLGAVAVGIDSLSLESGISFFEKRLRQLSDSERTAAGEFVDEVGALPLALEKAAAYIVNRGTRIQDYLASYRKRRLSLLDQPDSLNASGELSISAVLDPTLDEIEQTPASADVLRVASMLATDPIPIMLLVAGARELGEPIANALASAVDDPLAVDEVLDPLTTYSLIERNRESHAFTVHKLVSAVVRQKMRDSSRWQGKIVGALEAAFPNPTWENSAICGALIPHVMATRAWRNAATLRNRVAAYMLIRGDYSRAEYYLQAVEPDKEDYQSIIASQLLAQVYFAQRRFQDAIDLLGRSLESAEKMLLGEETRTKLLLNLAACLFAIGDPAQASGAYSAALDEAMRHQDQHHVVVALCGQAGILAVSQPDVAIEKANEAVVHAEQGGVYTKAIAYSSLAQILIDAGRAREPRTMHALQQALKAGEQVYGPEHPALAATLRMYAVLLHADGQDATGQGVYQRAQAIIDSAMGPQSATAITFRSEYESMIAAASASAYEADSNELPIFAEPSQPLTVVAPPYLETGDMQAPQKPEQIPPPAKGRKTAKIVGATVLLAVLFVLGFAWFHRKQIGQTPPATTPEKTTGSTERVMPANAPPSPPPPEWGVRISEDKTLEPNQPEGPSAEWEALRARRSAFQYETVIFYRQGMYWTAIVATDQPAAEAIAAQVKKAAIFSNWRDADVLPIHQWCTNARFDRFVQVAEVKTRLYVCENSGVNQKVMPKPSK